MNRQNLQRVEVSSRAQWRNWLEDHHTQPDSIWLVTYKKVRPQWYLPYAEIVEEALCFGWIDSLPGKVDAERTMLLLSPRRKGSPWSALNKKRVADLIASGLMREPGLAKIERAQADGSWTLLDAIETLQMPQDLHSALQAHPVASQHWDQFPPSAKKGLLQYVASAKRPETRAKRIAEIVAKAALNVKAQFPQKKT